MFGARILIIDEGKNISEESQIIFAVHGYRIDVFRSLPAALAAYRDFVDSEEPYQVLLASVGQSSRNRLERLYLAGEIDSLVFLEQEQFCRDYYIIPGRIAEVCNFSSLFKCLKQMLKSPQPVAGSAREQCRSSKSPALCFRSLSEYPRVLEV